MLITQILKAATQANGQRMNPFFLKTINFLFPVSCSLCRKLLPYSDVYRICESCLVKLKKIDGLYCKKCGSQLPDGGEHCYSCTKNKGYHFESIRAYCVYEGAARDIVHKLKYAGRSYLAKIMGKLMIDLISVQGHKDSIDYIAPVPMHWIKRYMRGYNQAELLARKVSEYCGKPLLRGFKRKKFTKAQYSLTKEQRSNNISGSFIFDAAAGMEVQGKTVLLVDDVCTTCSTVEECSKTLVNAGAAKVYALTFAKD